jgi:hypothetical protein
LKPDTLYQPELGPSTALLGWTVAAAGVLVCAAVLVWWGRIAWHAPREQQREAEKLA